MSQTCAQVSTLIYIHSHTSRTSQLCVKSSHQCLDCGRRPQVHTFQLHMAYMCLYTATPMLPHTVRQRDANTAFLSHMGEGLLLGPELDGVGQGASPLGLYSWTLPPRMAPVLPSHTPLGSNPCSPTQSSCSFLSQERVWKTAGPLLLYGGWPLRTNISLLW